MDLHLLAEIERNSLRQTAQLVGKRLSRCGRILLGTPLIVRRVGFSLMARVILRRVGLLGMLGAGTRGVRGSTSSIRTMTKEEWLDKGFAKGWISIPTCYYHDMLPISDEEEAILDEDGEMCMTVVRLYG